MVDIWVQSVMTVQTISRVDACCDRVNDFLTGAVVTGVTGAGAVGRDVVLYTFDLSPGRDHVTFTTQ